MKNPRKCSLKSGDTIAEKEVIKPYRVVEKEREEKQLRYLWRFCGLRGKPITESEEQKGEY